MPGEMGSRHPLVVKTPLVTERLKTLRMELQDLEWSDSTSPHAALQRRRLMSDIARLQVMNRNGEIYDPQH